MSGSLFTSMAKLNFYAIRLALFIALAASAFAADDAPTLHKKGIEALKESQSNPEAIVTAARYFAQAAAQYEAQKNEALTVEMNSYLYWCKKKMTIKDIDAFLKDGNVAVAERLKIVEKAPAQEEAQAWFDRADTYARAHPDEHLLIAVRYFEVADRFRESDAGRAAMSLSLKEMQQITAPKASLEKVADEKSARPKQTPKVVNLMRYIDLTKDVVEGKWVTTGAALVGQKGDSSRLEIPYLPPEEYDFKVSFTRHDGVKAVAQMLSKSGHQFAWVMEAQMGKHSGFELIDGKTCAENKTSFRGRLIKNDEVHTSVIQVRNDGITAIVDGKQIAHWNTDYKDMDCIASWKLRDQRFLGVGQNNVKVTYTAIELVEITGYGKGAR